MQGARPLCMLLWRRAWSRHQGNMQRDLPVHAGFAALWVFGCMARPHHTNPYVSHLALSGRVTPVGSPNTRFMKCKSWLLFLQHSRYAWNASHWMRAGCGMRMQDVHYCTRRPAHHPANTRREYYPTNQLHWERASSAHSISGSM